MSWISDLTEWANKTPPWLLLFVSVLGLGVSVWARLLARKAIKVNMRQEVHRLRDRWHKITPALVATGGALDNDVFADFARLLADARLVSRRLHRSLRSAYDSTNDITTLNATGVKAGEPPRHEKWLRLKTQIRATEDSFARLLRIRL